MRVTNASDVEGPRIGSLIGNAGLVARLAGHFLREPSHLELKNGDPVHEGAMAPNHLPHGGVASGGITQKGGFVAALAMGRGHGEASSRSASGPSSCSPGQTAIGARRCPCAARR